ncbi:MAG: response regulator [Thermoleophilaceae bacterium]
MIRVLLADDHGVVREGLSRLLSTADGIEVLPLARDGEEAVAIAAEHEPDVVLMDLSMPRLDGAEATRRILATNPEVQVVILTSFSDREQILGALSAGAIGYLLKDAEPGDLIEGVHAAARGESPLHPKAAREVLNLRESAAPSEELTARELEVLGLLAEGLPNKRISMRLGISEKTVKAHVTSIFNRIGVTDRTQAALWARDHGIG